MKFRKALCFLSVLLTTLGLCRTSLAYTVRTGHPRIWLNPTRVAEMKAKVAAGDDRWTDLKAFCDGFINEQDVYGTIWFNYALAWQLTGDTKYADKAISLVRPIAQAGPFALTHAVAKLGQESNAGYNVRDVLPAIAVVYDWCYDRMSAEDKALFKTNLEADCDWVWPDTNPSRVGGWSVENPGDNFFHGFMMTWLGGLALYGDSPKAQGYIDTARNKWLNKAVPYMEKYQSGGYMLEGTSYGVETLFRIFWYLDAHFTATGEDLLTTPGFNWPKEAIRLKLYTATPLLDRMCPTGDQARDANAPLSDYARSAAMVSLSHFDPITNGYTKWWLDHITPNRNAWRWEKWQELVWYKKDVVSTDYTQALPTGYLSRSAGFMTSRSGWDKDATFITMICGPARESHQDLAQNEFLIFKGDWLVSNTRLRAFGGINRQAADNNVFTIGGLQQPEVDENNTLKDTPHVVNFVDTNKYALMVGDASDAYSFWKWPAITPVLKVFKRELFFLKPNVVVLFDNVNAVDATKVKSFHLNTLNEPVVTGDNFTATVPGFILFGKNLLPGGGLVKKLPLNLGPNGALSSWRVDIDAPVGNNQNFFLNVLEAAKGDQAVPTTAVFLESGKNQPGVLVGANVVLFNQEPLVVPVQYKVKLSGVVDNYITDMKPNTDYTVDLKDSIGSTVQTQVVSSNAQGVLIFQSKVAVAGTYTVGIH